MYYIKKIVWFCLLCVFVTSVGITVLHGKVLDKPIRVISGIVLSYICIKNIIRGNMT